MEEHLFLLCPLQQEKGTESGIVLRPDVQVQASLHQARQLAPHQGTEGVVIHIALDGVEHSRALDDAVVIAGLEKGGAPGRWFDRA